MNGIEKHNFKKCTKNINIAIIVLSGLTILTSLAALIFINFAYSIVVGNEAITEMIGNADLGYSTSLQGEDFILGNMTMNVYDLMTLGLSFFLTFSVFVFLGAIFSLGVSIYTYKKINDASSIMFLLNIISTALALSSVNIIRFILLIISSVFVYKIRD